MRTLPHVLMGAGDSNDMGNWTEHRITYSDTLLGDCFQEYLLVTHYKHRICHPSSARYGSLSWS